MNKDKKIEESKKIKNKQCHYIIKSNFHESHLEFEASMIIIGNTKKNSFETVYFAVDGNFEIKIELNWNEFLENLKTRRKEVYERRSKYFNVINRLEQEFTKCCPIKFIKEINDYVLTTEDKNLLHLLLKDKFMKIINKVLGHSLEIEDMEIDTEIKFYEDPTIKESENKKSINIKMEEIYLDIIPVIDPMYGIKIENLKVGQNILVKIIDDTQLGKYLAKALIAENNSEQIKCQIIEINKEYNTKNSDDASVIFDIIVEFDQNLKGRFQVQYGVKIKNKTDTEKLEELEILKDEIKIYKKIEKNNQPEIKSNDYMNYFIFFFLIISIIFFIIMLI